MRELVVEEKRRCDRVGIGVLVEFSDHGAVADDVPGALIAFQDVSLFHVDKPEAVEAAGAVGGVREPGAGLAGRSAEAGFR